MIVHIINKGNHVECLGTLTKEEFKELQIKWKSGDRRPNENCVNIPDDQYENWLKQIEDWNAGRVQNVKEVQPKRNTVPKQERLDFHKLPKRSWARAKRMLDQGNGKELLKYAKKYDLMDFCETCNPQEKAMTRFNWAFQQGILYVEV